MSDAIKTALIAAAIVFVSFAVLGPGLGLITTTKVVAGTAVTAKLTIAGALKFAAITGLTTLVASGVGMLSSRGHEAARQNFSGSKIAGVNGQAPRQIVYGRCRVGGTIFHLDTHGNGLSRLSVAVALAGHEIESVENLWLNDVQLTGTAGTVNGSTVHRITNGQFTNTDNDDAFTGGSLGRVSYELGDQTTANGLARSASGTKWPATSVLRGIAYAFLELVHDREKNAQSPKIWAEVKGKKVYDPRTGTTAWSDNPALIIRDFLTDQLYGMKAPASEINDANALGGFRYAADICDEDVTFDGEATKRYTCNVFTDASASLDGVLDMLLSSCAGNITYTNGKFNLFVGGPRTATMTLADADMLSAVRIETRGRSGELYNAAKALFVDASANWNGSEAPPCVSNEYADEDTPGGGGSAAERAPYRKTLEIQLPCTTDHITAQRLAKIALERQRRGLTANVLTTLKFHRCQPGDWIKVTNDRMGWNDKLFEIASMQIEFLPGDEASFGVANRMALQEIDAGVYDFDSGDIVDPLDQEHTAPQAIVVGPPTSLALAQSTLTVGSEQGVTVTASWVNAAQPSIAGTELAYRRSGTTQWIAAATLGRGETRYEIDATHLIGLTYELRARHLTIEGVASAWTATASIAVTDPDTSVAPPTVGTGGMSTNRALATSGFVTAPSDASVNAIKVYYSTTSGFEITASGISARSFASFPGERRSVVLGNAQGLSYDTDYYFRFTACTSRGVESEATTEYRGRFSRAKTSDIDDSAVTIAKFADGIEPVTIISGNLPTAKSTEVIFQDGKLKFWNGTAYVDVDSGATGITAVDFAAGIEPVKIVSTLPSEKDTELVVLTTDRRLYTWDPSVDTDDDDTADGAYVPAPVDHDNLLANSIRAGSIAAGAVRTEAIQAGSITSSRLGANSVIAGAIAAGAVRTEQLAVGSVETVKIADGAIVASKIAADSVTVGKLGLSSGALGTGRWLGLGQGTQLLGHEAVIIVQGAGSNIHGIIALSRPGAGSALAAGAAGTEINDHAIFASNLVYQAGGTGGAWAQPIGGLQREAWIGGGNFAGWFSAGDGGDGGSVRLCHTGPSLHVVGNITATGTITPFTGAHLALVDRDLTLEEGDVLVDGAIVARGDVSNVVFDASLSSSTSQKTAIGVYSGESGPPPSMMRDLEAEPGKPTDEELDPVWAETMRTKRAVLVNALGEGQINVVSEGGDIAAGDLLVTSSTAGKAMRQADDILRSSTVARAREGLAFGDRTTGQVACIYLCG